MTLCFKNKISLEILNKLTSSTKGEAKNLSTSVQTASKLLTQIKVLTVDTQSLIFFSHTVPNLNLHFVSLFKQSFCTVVRDNS